MYVLYIQCVWLLSRLRFAPLGWWKIYLGCRCTIRDLYTSTSKLPRRRRRSCNITTIIILQYITYRRFSSSHATRNITTFCWCNYCTYCTLHILVTEILFDLCAQSVTAESETPMMTIGGPNMVVLVE